MFAQLFASSPHAFWLDAGPEADMGWSLLGSLGPEGVLALGDPAVGEVELYRPGTGERFRMTGSVLELLDRGIPAAPAAAPACEAPPAGERAGHEAPFRLGWAGWIGYETGAAALGVPIAAGSGPDSALLYADRLVAFDHERRVILLSALTAPEAPTEAQEEWLLHARSVLSALPEPGAGDAPADPSDAPAGAPVRLRHDREDYLRLIEQCRERIRRGDAYQLCLTNRFETTATEDPLAVYRRLRQESPTPRGGFLRAGAVSVLSSSPESFLSVTPGGRVRTRPIKGTRRRGSTEDEDRRLRRELAEDAKERAENVMIVDLMRNDLSRVAVLGSVEVEELFAVEAYRTVFQLVSTVGAQLAADVTRGDVVRATFPGGSMTGAPKESAMRILHGLEGAPRGPYAGAFGFLSRDGAMELSMTIRSIVLRDGVAVVGAGGGITALSDPAFEFEESLIKAAPLLAALGAAAPCPNSRP